MKDCCKLSENLETKQERPDLRIDTCKQCGSRHFELTADAGEIGIVGIQLGS